MNWLPKRRTGKLNRERHRDLDGSSATGVPSSVRVAALALRSASGFSSCFASAEICTIRDGYWERITRRSTGAGDTIPDPELVPFVRSLPERNDEFPLLTGQSSANSQCVAKVGVRALVEAAREADPRLCGQDFEASCAEHPGERAAAVPRRAAAARGLPRTGTPAACGEDLRHPVRHMHLGVRDGGRADHRPLEPVEEALPA